MRYSTLREIEKARESTKLWERERKHLLVRYLSFFHCCYQNYSTVMLLYETQSYFSFPRDLISVNYVKPMKISHSVMHLVSGVDITNAHLSQLTISFTVVTLQITK